jgi:hypothetical protein
MIKIIVYLHLYRIETAKKDVSEALVEYNKMYDLNRSLKLRNERLSKTKEVNVARTLQQYKTETNDYRSKQSLNKDHVLAEMKELWKWKQSQDREIASRLRLRNLFLIFKKFGY